MDELLTALFFGRERVAGALVVVIAGLDGGVLDSGFSRVLFVADGGGVADAGVVVADGLAGVTVVNGAS